MSLTQIWGPLFVGTTGDAEALADSNPFGITTGVSLCPKPVPDEIPGINYRYLPMLGNRPPPGQDVRRIHRRHVCQYPLGEGVDLQPLRGESGSDFGGGMDARGRLQRPQRRPGRYWKVVHG
jgi:hypothetical protein